MDSVDAAKATIAEARRLEQERLDEKKRLKRAANRRSACTSRVRKKQFVEEMTAANARLQLYGAILSRAPPTVTLDANCRVRFASRTARELLLLPVEGALGDVDLRDLLADGPARRRQAEWLRASAAGEDATPKDRPRPAWPPAEWGPSRAHAVSNSSRSENSGTNSEEGRSNSAGSRRDQSHSGGSEGSDSDGQKEDQQASRGPPPASADVAMKDVKRGSSRSSDGAASCNACRDVRRGVHVSDSADVSNSAGGGSSFRDGEGEEDDVNACRLELACRDGRVVAVDAVRGGSFRAGTAVVPAAAAVPPPADGSSASKTVPSSPPASPHGYPAGSGNFTRGESFDSIATAAGAPPLPDLDPPRPGEARETVFSLRPACDYEDASDWLGSLRVGAPRTAPTGPSSVRSAVYDAIRSARAPSERLTRSTAPRSPPKIEELCDESTTPDDLQNVVDGLMLIANAGLKPAAP